MLKNFDVPILNFAGDPITIDGNAQATAFDVIINALLVPDSGLNPSQKFKQYQLAERLYGNQPEVEVSTEELALIKEVVGKFYPPMVVGRIYNLIEE